MNDAAYEQLLSYTMETLCCGGRCQGPEIHEGGCECGIYREQAIQKLSEVGDLLSSTLRKMPSQDIRTSLPK